MAQSASHIYLSALPFAPSSSVISKSYISKFSSFQLKRGQLMKWPALEMMISVPNNKPVVCIASSKNDEYIAAEVYYKGVYIWNTSTGTIVSGPFRIGEAVVSLAFSPDGQCLACGLLYGNIQIWDVITGQQVVVEGQKQALVGHEGAVSALVFAEDGKHLVSGSYDHTVLVWDLQRREVVVGPLGEHNNFVWSVSFLADQDHIVSRSGFHTVQVWNITTGQRAMQMDVATGTIHSVVHYGHVFSCDNSRIKSGFNTYSETEAESREEEKYKPGGSTRHWTQAVAFSPNGELVATCNSNYIHVWYATGQLAGTLAGGPFKNDRVLCLAFLADGQRIISGSDNGTVRVWNVQLMDNDASESADQKVALCAAFTSDNKQIVVGQQDGTAEVLDISTGRKEVKIMEEEVQKISVSLNGNWIALASKDELYMYSQSTGKIESSQNSSDNEDICSIVFSSVIENLAAFGTVNGTVYVLNVPTSTIIAGPRKIGVDSVTSLAFSPIATDSIQIIIAVGCHNQVFLWSIIMETMMEDSITGPYIYHEGRIRALAFSIDGKYIISVADDYSLCAWDFMTGNILWRPEKYTDIQKMNLDWKGSPISPYASIAFINNEWRVAFIGKRNTVLIFKVNGNTTLQDPLVLAGHINDVRSIAFSRDGQYLVTTSYDQTIRIWDLQSAIDLDQALILSMTSSDPHINFDKTFINSDGWAICIDGENGPFLRRLMWIPEIHRATLYRLSNLLVSGKKETKLDFDIFFCGKEWIRCKT